MPVIDADAHVIETSRTWEFVDEAEQPFAPVEVAPPPGRRARGGAYWLIDGRVHPRDANVSNLFPRESRELLDVAARLRHMDELGIDIQVLFPSILSPYTDRPETERAFCRSYNRWLADACGHSHGRLRWAAILPLMDMAEALAELRFARDHAACAVFIRTVEGERQIYEPYFFPLYEEAARLDVPICVHASVGNPILDRIYARGRGFGAFPRFQLPVLAAFHELILNDVPAQFPTLRWGFVETSSKWLPYILQVLLRRPRTRQRTGPELMRENRLYVACEVDDDLPYVLQFAGEDHLVIGTDYGHADPHQRIDAVAVLRSRTDVEPRIVEKILDDNARALYGL